jgi:acetyl-CoA carboxylase biotin carboxyl carrier protein
MKKFQLDIEAIRQLANVLSDTGLTEIECETEGCRIYVSKQTQIVAPVHYNQDLTPKTESQTQAAPALQVEKNKNFIKSPMVGTLYLAKEPGATPFIKVGDSIQEGQMLLIIEAMKVMNPLKSPQNGIVKEILVSDGTPVEYGQPLLVIE